jgi:hypothetical protein
MKVVVKDHEWRTSKLRESYHQVQKTFQCIKPAYVNICAQLSTHSPINRATSTASLIEATGLSNEKLEGLKTTNNSQDELLGNLGPHIVNMSMASRSLKATDDLQIEYIIDMGHVAHDMSFQGKFFSFFFYCHYHFVLDISISRSG